MATPIRFSPVLEGEDAERFLRLAKEVEDKRAKMTKEELEQERIRIEEKIKKIGISFEGKLGF